MLNKIRKQKEYFQKKLYFSYNERLNNLKVLAKTIKKHEKELYLALFDDLGKNETEAFVTELALVYEEIHLARKKLKKWMKNKKVPTSLGQFPARSYISYQAYGQVLIMTPWNYPFMLTMVPLVGALAAGNVVVIKPSAYSPQTALIMKKIIDKAYKNDVILFTGGRAVNEQILDIQYDYIFFTGSTSVGKLVMNKASQTLTPITLELGGKSPVIVTPSADIDLTVRRLKWAKLINLGQTCVAPDYIILVGDNQEFVTKIISSFELTTEEKGRLGKIVNEKHFMRLKEYLDEVKEPNYDLEKQIIHPTVIVEPSFDSPLMNEEIFGPILPIIKVKTLQEAVAFINKKEKPLAMYLYTKNKKDIDIVSKLTTSGSLTINDSLIQLANPHLPFGGVGASGMGSYHGHKSFTTFSHQRSVLNKSRYFDLKFRYKFDEKSDKLFKKLMRNK